MASFADEGSYISADLGGALEVPTYDSELDQDEANMDGFLFLRITDVSSEGNCINLCLHDDVSVPAEELSALICASLFNVPANDVDAIGTYLEDGSNEEALVYPIASLSNTPGIFRSMSEKEWIPLFFSETSNRYFYFGPQRDIVFIGSENPSLPAEGRGRPLTAASSDHTNGLKRFRPTRSEGKGRPMSAAPSDKSGGRRRHRPTKTEGAGRPLSASPGDRRTWDSAYQPSPTGVQTRITRNSQTATTEDSKYWYPLRKSENDSSSHQRDQAAMEQLGGSARPHSAPATTVSRNVVGQPRTAWGKEENESALSDSSADVNSDDGWVLVDGQAEEVSVDDTDDVDSEMYEDAGSKWKRAWEAENGHPEDETDDEHTLGRDEDDEEEESSADEATRDWSSSSSEEEEPATEILADGEDASLFSGMQPESWKSSLPMKQRVRGLGPL